MNENTRFMRDAILKTLEQIATDEERDPEDRYKFSNNWLRKPSKPVPIHEHDNTDMPYVSYDQLTDVEEWPWETAYGSGKVGQGFWQDPEELAKQALAQRLVEYNDAWNKKRNVFTDIFGGNPYTFEESLTDDERAALQKYFGKVYRQPGGKLSNAVHRAATTEIPRYQYMWHEGQAKRPPAPKPVVPTTVAKDVDNVEPPIPPPSIDTDPSPPVVSADNTPAPATESPFISDSVDSVTTTTSENTEGEYYIKEGNRYRNIPASAVQVMPTGYIQLKDNYRPDAKVRDVFAKEHEAFKKVSDSRVKHITSALKRRF